MASRESFTSPGQRPPREGQSGIGIGSADQERWEVGMGYGLLQRPCSWHSVGFLNEEKKQARQGASRRQGGIEVADCIQPHRLCGKKQKTYSN